MTMHFDATGSFDRDRKRLAKRYRSLDEDLAELKKMISLFPTGNGKHFAILVETDTVRIVKARLFCRYLKGSSLRIIYAYCEAAGQIDFIELYCKGDQEAEDETRIKEYLKV
jgi:hypothetical protein